MAIDNNEVKKIAHLARLELKDDKLEAITNSISDVLALVDQLQAVDTSDITPLAHPLDAVQTLRVDAVTESNQREKLLANAPATENGLFLVPQVIE